ncbi:hypothetical protein [Bosea sp. (in: a-proteobacteria)]|jgi:hypothetical protein|uniref:hypothetical protein n=1 Tax=Bosea sp. (in: a-proteobacteria) TaxID=1871050 RepID=UPI003568F735
MTNNSHLTDAAGALATPRRPGQSGEETEHRAGPNPRSANPTGPHAPYEPDDPNGLAAEKHIREAVDSKAGEPTAGKERGHGIAFVDLSRGKP